MKKLAVLTGINDYAGQANDLQGCVADVNQWGELLTGLGFTCLKLYDEQVTRDRFCTELRGLVKTAEPGDYIVQQYSGHGSQIVDRNGDEPDGYDETLYLRDGHLPDDDTNGILKELRPGVFLALPFDACHTGTGTRAFDRDKGIRFHPVNGRAVYKQGKVKKRGLIKTEGMPYIYLSGCAENQTSADAFINYGYHGAFTYYACKAFVKGLTYKQWHTEFVRLLRKNKYEQIPQLEGDPDMLGLSAFGTEKKKCTFKFW